MLKEQDIYSAFISFPSPNHVMSVCKPNKDEQTCRHLAMEGKGFRCIKASPFRRIIDEETEAGATRAKGDNCEGILGFVVEKQDLLVGNPTEYEEGGPRLKEKAQFQFIKVEDGLITLATSKSVNPRISENHVQIDVYKDSIRFSARGVGPLGGELKVYFEDRP